VQSQLEQARNKEPNRPRLSDLSNRGIEIALFWSWRGIQRWSNQTLSNRVYSQCWV